MLELRYKPFENSTAAVPCSRYLHSIAACDRLILDASFPVQPIGSCTAYQSNSSRTDMDSFQQAGASLNPCPTANMNQVSCYVARICSTLHSAIYLCIILFD